MAGEGTPLMGGERGRRGSSKLLKPLTIAVSSVLLVAFFSVLGVTMSRDRSRSAPFAPDALATAMERSMMLTHLGAWDSFRPNRAVGTEGFAATSAYVTGVLDTLDMFTYKVQPFTIETSYLAGTPTFTVETNSEPISLVFGRDFQVSTSSGPGNFTGKQLTQLETFGCNDTEYTPEMADTIVVVPIGGGCGTRQKATMANNSANRPAGLMIVNDVPDLKSNRYRRQQHREKLGACNHDVLTLDGMSTNSRITLPVFIGIGDTKDVLDALITSGAVVSAGQEIGLVYETTNTNNVIAETKEGDADSVVVVGSHLDSVPAGPGINDNGSGSTANLVMAQQMQALGYKPVNKVRLCWFGAEEVGLLGSTHYVQDLVNNNPAEYSKIQAMLNYDMLASPNYVRGIYNGTECEQFPQSVCKGSDYIKDLYKRRFDELGVTSMLVPFTGRSDYGPFLDAGTPCGGLFTGAEGIKSEEERALFGGVIDAPYDACYHQPCDTADNVHLNVLGEMADAAAYVLQTLADDPNLHETLYE